MMQRRRDYRCFSLIVAGLMILNSCGDPSGMMDSGWKAQWIGPEVSPADPGSEKLKDVSWIWGQFGRSVADFKASEVPVAFRKIFNTEAGKELTSASLYISTDDAYTVYLNGMETGSDDNWTGVEVYDVFEWIKPGENLMAVRAENISVRHTNLRGTGNSPAGLIALLEMEYEDGSKTEIRTDRSWEYTGDFPEDWPLEETEEASWKTVVVLDREGLAQWGGHDPEGNAWYCFRKTLQLESKNTTMPARIGADSKYWLWINGELAVFEGGLKRGPRPGEGYYDEVDLAPFMEEGENTIAVLLWYWGRHSFSHENSGQPGFLFEMDTPGGSVISNDSWKIRKHPAYGHSGPPHPNYRLAEFNIHYDARRGIEDWIQPGYDDAGWDQAAKFGSPPVAPWNRLQRRPIPQWFNSGLLAYEDMEIHSGQDGKKTVTANLPQNAHITPWLRVKAPAGLLIDMRMDNYTGGSENSIRSEYITREGVQEFEALAWMNGHAVIYTMPADVEVLDLKYRETGFDAPVTGYFHTSDEFLNVLWDKSLRTLQVCMRDNYFDCPDRERAQWWGDAVIELGQTFYTLDRVSDSLTKKAMRELVDWQRADGTIYSPVPAGNWDAELPGQMLMSVGRYGFWNYYMHTGDTAMMHYVYPAVKEYLGLWEMDDGGLIIHREGGWDWGDWGDNKDRPLLDNCYYTLALQSAAEMAKLTGNPEDLAFYEDRIRSIREGFNARFWTGSEYRSPGYTGQTDDRGNGLAVVAGIARPEHYPGILRVLQEEFHASPYTEKYVLEALYMMNEPGLAMERMRKRFGLMVDSPSTTLYEGWGIGSAGYGGGTINHSWSGGPLILMAEYLAGVAPIEPAYSRFRVAPNPGDLETVDLNIPSVRGQIEVRIRNQSRIFEMDLSIPEGSECLAGIPLKDDLEITTIILDGKTVWENGKPAGENESIEPGNSDSHIHLSVGPGNRNFTARYE